MGWSCASVSEPLEWAPVPAGGDKDTRARVRVEGSRGGGDSKGRWGQQGEKARDSKKCKLLSSMDYF